MTGSLLVICGSMFSGKTEELLRLVRRSTYAARRVVIVKPETDVLHPDRRVRSHAQQVAPEHPLVRVVIVPADGAAPPGIGSDEVLVAIDEAQFFGPWIVPWARGLVQRGHRVVAAGLDLDYLERPFGSMPLLLAHATEVRKLTAVCACGGDAVRSLRLVPTGDAIEVGAEDKYQALCLTCYGAAMRALASSAAQDS